MLVEALFWFHPLVWWIGTRLITERELASDEAILQNGGDSETYAEAIVNVCKRYQTSPLTCVSSISGSANLKSRIEAIMFGNPIQNLTLAKRALLAIAALAAPVAVGLLKAETKEAFDVATVKENKVGARAAYPGLEPGNQRFTAKSLPLMALIMLAYDVTPSQISGLPRSFERELYDVEASCERPMTKEQSLRMLQTLLADRFRLALHKETQEEPIFAITIAKGGPKFKESTDEGAPDRRGTTYKRTPMSTLALILSQGLDRVVVDKTGLTARYDFALQYARGRTQDPADAPSVFTALQEQLGLKLEPQKGPVSFLIIDHAEKPSEN